MSRKITFQMLVNCLKGGTRFPVANSLVPCGLVPRQSSETVLLAEVLASTGTVQLLLRHLSAPGLHKVGRQGGSQAQLFREGVFLVAVP